MAESTITKILLRRGPAIDLDLSAGGTSDGDVKLDQGEPGFVTDTGRLYIGDGTKNVPIPKVDGTTIDYNLEGELKLGGQAQIHTVQGGVGCGSSSAIAAINGGIYSKLDINCSADVISFCASDEQLKENINIIEDPLTKLRQLKGVTFEWNYLQDSYTGADTGIIAQDVEKTNLPGIVETRANGYKAVKYERLIPLLIESVKRLDEKVTNLSSMINNDTR